MRSSIAIYGILDRCSESGYITKVGRKYRLTDTGISVYNLYVKGYDSMKANLIGLETVRLRRLGIEVD